MTEELTYETIPNEFWPKCFWCGEDLGDCTVEVDTEFNKRRICTECEMIVRAIVENSAPYFIAEILGQFERHPQIRKTHKYRLVGINEVKTEATQNMKKHRASGVD